MNITSITLPLIKLAESYLKTAIKKAQPLTQGDVSEVFLITTQDNRQYIIKNGVAPMTEGNMLKTLASYHIHVPKVILHKENILILEYIKETNCLSKEAWKNLGETLTQLHQVKHPTYGWQENYAFGKVAINNKSSSNWIDFWGEQRIGCYLNQLPITTSQRLEKLIHNLADYIPKNPMASLLHGDLWTGNILTHINKPYLIDPACYFGHNEVDIAMLNVFGSLPDIFYKSYNLLESGWQERQSVYQLFPAIVHYLLFGNYYLELIHQKLDDLKI